MKSLGVLWVLGDRHPSQTFRGVNHGGSTNMLCVVLNNGLYDVGSF